MKNKAGSMLSMLMIVAVCMMSMLTTSCETIKDQFAGSGVEEKIKAAAKDWIIKKIDELGVPKTSPVIVDRAEDITDPELKEEVLSQLNK